MEPLQTHLKIYTIPAGSSEEFIYNTIKEVVTKNHPHAIIREKKSGAVIAYISFNDVFRHTHTVTN